MSNKLIYNQLPFHPLDGEITHVSKNNSQLITFIREFYDIIISKGIKAFKKINIQTNTTCKKGQTTTLLIEMGEDKKTKRSKTKKNNNKIVEVKQNEINETR